MMGVAAQHCDEGEDDESYNQDDLARGEIEFSLQCAM